MYHFSALNKACRNKQFLLTLVSTSLFVIAFLPTKSLALTVNSSFGGVDSSGTALKQGLVGHWTFDGADLVSNVTDKSGNGNHGYMVNMATSTAKTGGVSGQALKFDGVNDYVTIPDPVSGILDFGTSDFSVGLWIKRTRLGIYAIFSKSNGDIFSVGNGFEMYTDGSNIVNFIVGNGSSSYINIPLSVSITDTNWKHIVFVVNRASPSSSKAYLNGVLSTGTVTGSLSPASSINNSLPVTFATEADGGYFFPGTIDDIRLYNRALSASEIKKLYNLGASVVNSSVAGTGVDTLRQGLANHWTFDGADLTSNVTDKSGNSNTGYMVNMATSTAKTGGVLGQAIKPDGINDYIRTSGTLNLGSNKVVSISLWTYKDSFGSDDAIVFESSTNFNLNDGAIVFGQDASSPCAGYMVLAIQDSVGSAKFRLECYTRPSSKAWHHYVAIFDNTTTAGDVRLFIDGVEQNPVSTPLNTKDKSSTLSGYDWYFLSRAGTAQFNSAKLDDVRIYNRTLSASEVKQLYNQGASKMNTISLNTGGDKLKQGLVGHWTFDGADIVSNITDKSGNGRTGYMINIATSTAKVGGVSGQALNFNKINDQHVIVADAAALDGTSTLSFGGWFYMNALPAGALIYSSLLCKRIDPNGDNSYCSFINSSGYLNVDVVGFTDRFTGNTVFAPKKWYHFMVVFNGNLSAGERTKLYVNGVLDKSSSSSYTLIPNYSGNLGLGILQGNTAGYLDGRLDDIRVYNRALSAPEVKQLYNTGR